MSAAYDLFGNGRTALKASASRGVEQDSIRYASANNPAATLVTSVNTDATVEMVMTPFQEVMILLLEV